MELLLALLGLPVRCTCEARRSCKAPAHPCVSAFVFSLFKTLFFKPPRVDFTSEPCIGRTVCPGLTQAAERTSERAQLAVFVLSVRESRCAWLPDGLSQLLFVVQD